MTKKQIIKELKKQKETLEKFQLNFGMIGKLKGNKKLLGDLFQETKNELLNG
jgi:hypothetical protein